jgi:hypothetical protein
MSSYLGHRPQMGKNIMRGSNSGMSYTQGKTP